MQQQKPTVFLAQNSNSQIGLRITQIQKLENSLNQNRSSSERSTLIKSVLGKGLLQASEPLPISREEFGDFLSHIYGYLPFRKRIVFNYIFPSPNNPRGLFCWLYVFGGRLLSFQSSFLAFAGHLSLCI
jgi:hypothetical protein